MFCKFEIFGKRLVFSLRIHPPFYWSLPGRECKESKLLKGQIVPTTVVTIRTITERENERKNL